MFASSHGDGFSAGALFRSHVPLFSFGRFLLLILLLMMPAVAIVWLLGSSNPYTPAGYVGYLTKGAIFGKSRFHGVQKGPTSTSARSTSSTKPSRHRS